ncbi:hypothetical protein [Halobaculum gomorrense]|uniref:DUF7992 domain-containing protein n=1 Tax=Halobaculum gomorrense TaxID=43928 RepID=A0A1M5MTK9_9EURY|nr:hypothetical protein [Halobaculum gomorrense]SHG80710.1 hypothetical protein SAMN05443636_1143 [Halobaculum gomorrense]
MTLDVDVSDPPSLRGPRSRGEYDAVDAGEDESGDDYRRETIQTALHDGAWGDAFAEWADSTYLSVEEFETVGRLGLFGEFDFYWDPAGDEVGYRAPSIPEADREVFPDRGADGVDEELDDLGRAISEMLESDYLRRDEEDDESDFFAEEEERESEAEARDAGDDPAA